MQIIGTVIIIMGAAFWQNHTHKVEAWNPRPPEFCQSFEHRYAPENKAFCDEAALSSRK